MTETDDESKLADALERLAVAAFGVASDSRSRAAAAEIAGLMARLRDTELEPWETPAMAKVKDGDDGAED